MASLDELKKLSKKTTITTTPQTPSEKLEAIRPTESIPPRIITHSYDPSAGHKQKQSPDPLGSLQHNDDD